MLSEVRARDPSPVSVSAGPGADDDQKKLPVLDTLVARLPAGTRAALDELFRAKFTFVRRVPEGALKP